MHILFILLLPTHLPRDSDMWAPCWGSTFGRLASLAVLFVLQFNARLGRFRARTRSILLGCLDVVFDASFPCIVLRQPNLRYCGTRSFRFYSSVLFRIFTAGPPERVCSWRFSRIGMSYLIVGKHNTCTPPAWRVLGALEEQPALIALLGGLLALVNSLQVQDLASARARHNRHASPRVGVFPLYYIRF